ncbi:MAG TPA: glycosyltransferase family 2 protein [Holophagaceae bacterium]|nr:glycosyltransferase family 2 protein [Holophagaceae bacterium]
MKVSIVTVVYNNPMVGEALDSILAQKFEGELELVVIDGGSTDGTLEVLERYRDRVAVLVSERDKGIYDGMNKGLSRATGDIIGTLNSDDLYFDDRALDSVVKAFEANDVDAVYGDLVYVRREEPGRVVRYWESRPYQDGLFERGWMPPHPTFFVRREVYARHGLFDLEYRLASDFELMMRFMAKARIRTVHIPRVLVRMRLGGATNKSLRNILKGNLEGYRACRKNGLKAPVWFIPRKILSKVPQFFKKMPDA